MSNSAVCTMNLYESPTRSFEEEASLIVESQSDPNAFAPLYESYYDPIFLFLLRRSGNRSVAEDLTSETFIKAIRGLSGYQHRRKTPFLAWLYRIAHNTFVSHCRKESVRRLFRQRKIEETPKPESSFASPSAETEQNMLRDQLLKLIKHLKQKDQFIVTLRYFEDLGVKEIAQVTGLSEPTTRTRLHRALMRLKKVIESEAPSLAALIQGEA